MGNVSFRMLVFGVRLSDTFRPYVVIVSSCQIFEVLAWMLPGEADYAVQENNNNKVKVI